MSGIIRHAGELVIARSATEGVLSSAAAMDDPFRRWLRPGRRSERLLASVVVAALVGWLALAASHVHAGFGAADRAAAALQLGNDHAPGDHGDSGDRSHACSLCAALDRAAAPAQAFQIAFLSGPERTARPDGADPAPTARAAAPYRSRAPPHA
jgi:hypothetical protein